MLQKCKTLCHEPLEERQLLAVDSGMSAVFPQACEYYVSEQAATFATPVVTNRDETALVPGSVVDTNVPQRIYGPLPFEQSEMYVSMLPANWVNRANHPGGFDPGGPMRGGGNGEEEPPLIRYIHAYDATSGNHATHSHQMTTTTQLVIFQDATREGTVYVDLQVEVSPLDFDIVVDIVALDASGDSREDSHGNPANDYWTCEIISLENSVWHWAIPAGVPNAGALRDFQVVATATSKTQDQTQTLSIDVHIAYTEILVSIAGDEFKPVEPGNDTAVVGQKIEAKVDVDPFFTVVSQNGFLWDWDVSNNAILDYITNDSQGRVVTHSSVDLHEQTVKFYNPYGGSAGAACNFIVSWTNSYGQTCTKGISKGACINFVKPTVDDYIPTIATTFHNGKGAVDVRPFEFSLTNPPALQLGGVEPLVASDGSILPGPQFGIEWTAHVTPTSYAGGDIAFTQLIQSDITRISDSGITEVRSTNNSYVLDSSPQYDNVIVSVSSELEANDTPGSLLWNTDKSTKREDHYLTYLMYRPEGQDSIWVSLSFISWYWKGEARKNSSGMWELVPNSADRNTSQAYDTNVLPTWNTNFAYIPYI